MQKSAGLLMYRLRDGQLEVFLVHSGGPLFARKWDGYWSIPKGLIEEGEEPLQAALREFEEETGLHPGQGPFFDLGTVRQKSGKLVQAFAFAGDWPEGRELRSGTFTMEWPPHSGQMREFPEIDAAQFFPIEEARQKIVEAQRPLLDRLQELLRVQSGQGESS